MSNNSSPVCDPQISSSTLPPWKVILHNDDVNTVEFVLQKVREITKLEEELAIKRILEAHEKGTSLLLTTHREKAELIEELFDSHKITVTIEKS